ncbi:MAG: hypothetical protein AABY09_05710 [Nanoarchaeota archaeon]
METANVFQARKILEEIAGEDPFTKVPSHVVSTGLKAVLGDEYYADILTKDVRTYGQYRNIVGMYAADNYWD